MADQFLEWSDVKGFFRRRWKPFISVFLFIFLFLAIIAFVLPPIYRAETRLSIEEQQIPENFAGIAITTFAEERLNSIQKQVFRYERLEEIIKKFDLYPEIREKYGMGEAVRKMSKSIGLETESTSFNNPKTGQTMNATIAFRVFYEGRDPENVRNVADVLSELVLEEDTKLKEKKTAATTDFLSMELEGLKEQLRLYDNKISEFKQKHFGELPEHSGVNLANLGRLEREFDRVNMQIRDLEDRKIIIESQMATVDPMLPIMIDGENMARNPAERLKYLRLNLLSLQSVLHDKHPDINKLKREIQELENQIGVTDDYQVELKRLNSLKVELAAMEGRLGPSHPDVIKSTKEIELLEKSIAGKLNKDTGRNTPQKLPDNPVYLNLMTQKSSIDASINNLMDDRQTIQAEMAKLRQRIDRAPSVEKQYIELTRDYNTIKVKYDDIMNKLLAANVAKGLEEGEHGQRFEIVNHAALPVKPHKPDRFKIILLGFVLASGLGFGLSALLEGLDNSIKSEKELTKLVGLPVLTVISKVETYEEIKKKKIRKLIWAFTVCGFILVGVKIVHEYILPLDELFSIIQRNVQHM